MVVEDLTFSNYPTLPFPIFITVLVKSLFSVVIIMTVDIVHLSELVMYCDYVSGHEQYSPLELLFP